MCGVIKERILQLLKDSKEISTISLAFRLDINKADAFYNLLQLWKNEKLIDAGYGTSNIPNYWRIGAGNSYNSMSNFKNPLVIE